MSRHVTSDQASQREMKELWRHVALKSAVLFAAFSLPLRRNAGIIQRLGDFTTIWPFKTPALPLAVSNPPMLAVHGFRRHSEECATMRNMFRMQSMLLDVHVFTCCALFLVSVMTL